MSAIERGICIMSLLVPPNAYPNYMAWFRLETDPKHVLTHIPAEVTCPLPKNSHYRAFLDDQPHTVCEGFIENGVRSPFGYHPTKWCE